MCVKSPSITTPAAKVEAPVSSVEMDAAESTVANREGDRQRRMRALSRLQTMTGGAMQGTEAGTGKIKFKQMMLDRQDYEDWWRKLAVQFAPNRGRFSVDELPHKKPLRFNSRARQIPDDFAAGMKSGLTSPSRPWFTLTLYDNGLAELENVKAWLTEVQDIMQGAMLRTNLYDQLYDVYKEQGIFGTGALLIEEDDENLFHAQSLTVGSYAIGVDRRGSVNRFARQFRRTLRQLVEEFGEEKLPQELRYRLKEKPNNTRYELRNLIEPSEDFRQSDGTAGNFRYVSYWWLKGYNDPEFLRVGGYHFFKTHKISRKVLFFTFSSYFYTYFLFFATSKLEPLGILSR